MKEIRLIAFNRPHYLRQVVEGIERMRGLEQYRIVASVDQLPGGGHDEQVVALCRRLTSDVRLRGRLDCSKHIRINFTEMYEEGAEQVVYVEDDIVPASDCLEFCQEMTPVLRACPRIKCMTLMGNNQGNAFMAYRNIHGFRVSRWYSAWGNMWLREGLAAALSVWPDWWDNSDNVTWDARLMGQFLDQEWLSLRPLLSRVRNIGVLGRYCKTEQEYEGRVRDFWSDSDFSVPISRKWH